ncbi:MAG: signal peptide peptidase SppA [Planctomycetales bacterium]
MSLAVRLKLCAWLLLIPCLCAAVPEKTEKAEEEKSKPVPVDVTWGELELKGSYPEGPMPGGLFGELHESLGDIITRLDKAAADDKLTGVLLKIQQVEIGWGKMHELRQAIGRIRKAGKKVVAWVEEGHSHDYLLATACDEVVIPEPAALMLVGLRAEVSFFRNLFDKLDLKPDMLRVGEFKSAAEPFQRTEMSPEFREEMEAILDDYFRLIVQMVSEGRKLSEEEVKGAIDVGPLRSKDALEKKLVDRLAYLDEVEDGLKKDLPEGSKFKWIRKYGKKKIDTDFSGFGGMMKMMELIAGVEPPKRKSTTQKIAVIYAVGTIMSGRSQGGGLSGEVMGSETMIKAIRQAKDDSSVKGVVLRVDSPGGSALASDLMWRELKLLKKPFVVSMGDTAASGGYYISMGADRIFVEPGTLTGSIGVVGGKIGVQGLFDKMGINTTVISRGRNSGVLSMSQGFSQSERESMTKLLYDVYGQFTSKAAEGRKMPVETLEKLARGRVYTGKMAVDNHLVDEVGTLEDAYAAVKKLAGIEGKVERLVLPPVVSPLEALFGPLDPNAQSTVHLQLARELEALAPDAWQTVRQLGVMTLLSRERTLTVLPYRIRVR